MRFLTYPPLLALAVGLLGVACVRLTGRPGAATALAGLYTARAFALGLFVPWAIQIAVAQQGLEYRTPGVEPRFSLFQLAIAASFLVPALAIDVAARRARRARPPLPAGGAPVLARVRAAALAGLAAAVPLFALGTWLTYYVMQHTRTLGFPPEIFISPAPPASAVWLALPLTLVAGAIGGALGSGLGGVLRLNER